MSQVIGYAPGVYDLFHIGHLNILSTPRHRDRLVAGVVSDEMATARGAAGRWSRSRSVSRSSGISTSSTTSTWRPSRTRSNWHVVRFDRIFKGDDWRGTAKGDKPERDFEAVGVEVVYFPYTVHRPAPPCG